MGASIITTIAARDGRNAPPRREQGLLGDRWTVFLSALVGAAEVALLIAIWDPAHWQPLSLVVVLTAFMIFGEVVAVRIGRVYVSSTACATVLAMALLGPVPAAIIAAVGCAADWVINRKPAWAGLSNTVESSLATLAGALFIEAVGGDVRTGGYALTVFLGGVVNATANLMLLATVRRVRLGASLRHDLAVSFLPTIPFHLLGITLATAAAQIVAAPGDFPVLAAAVPVLVVSELLMRSVAAQHARSEEVMTLTEGRADLLEQALTAEVAERAWIAGHVHDQTLQTLAVARQDIEEALDGDREAMAAARGHLDAAVAELRRTLVHVHPASVAGQGLGPTLEVYAAQVLGRAGATWTVEVEPGVGEQHEALLYSLARELLGNAAKHARASHVRLRIAGEGKGDSVRLTVADDGVGIAPGATQRSGHFGLLTVRHRVAAAVGKLTIESAPGKGATIDVVLPAQRSE